MEDESDNSNGSDAPGTTLDDCSTSFRGRFDQALISKGQGNFETLSSVGANIAFWFKVKCPVVARQVGLPAGARTLLPPGDQSSARAIALGGGGHP